MNFLVAIANKITRLAEYWFYWTTRRDLLKSKTFEPLVLKFIVSAYDLEFKENGYSAAVNFLHGWIVDISNLREKYCTEQNRSDLIVFDDTPE